MLRNREGANEKEMLNAFRIGLEFGSRLQRIRMGSRPNNTYLHDEHYSLPRYSKIDLMRYIMVFLL